MRSNYCYVVMSAMTDRVTVSLLKFYICALHLIVIACMSLLPVPFTTISLHYAIVGLTNGKCTATPICEVSCSVEHSESD